MFKFIAAACGIVALSAACFMAGVTWTTMPGPVKTQPAAAQPAAAKRVIDDQDEAQIMRGGAISGFQSAGIVKETTRRKEDLNLITGPFFKALDQKSKKNVCETVYCYLLTMPRDYTLSEYKEVLKLKDGETGEDIGAYDGKTGLRLNLPEKLKQK